MRGLKGGGGENFLKNLVFWLPQGVILEKIPLYFLQYGRASVYGIVKPIKRCSSTFGSIFVKKNVFRLVTVFCSVKISLICFVKYLPHFDPHYLKFGCIKDGTEGSHVRFRCVLSDDGNVASETTTLQQ